MDAALAANDWIYHLQVGFLELLVIAWVVFAGAAIGSFLNVVAYRLPRGRSVVAERSSCPACGSPIRARDNLPIIGWLLLEGRCRDCAQPISPRYPLVEFLFMSISLILLFVQLGSGGENLPGFPEGTGRDLKTVILFPRWREIAIFLHHWFFFAVLTAWTLFRFDQSRVPLRFYLWCAALLLAGPAIWPFLLPENFFNHTLAIQGAWERWESYGYQIGGGILTGLIIGAVAWIVFEWRRPGGVDAAGLSPDLLGIATLGGIVLGARGLVAVAIMTGIITLCCYLVCRASRQPLRWRKALAWSCCAAFLVHHVFWRSLDRIASYLAMP